jgi:hypothetical protein
MLVMPCFSTNLVQPMDPNLIWRKGKLIVFTWLRDTLVTVHSFRYALVPISGAFPTSPSAVQKTAIVSNCAIQLQYNTLLSQFSSLQLTGGDVGNLEMSDERESWMKTEEEEEVEDETVSSWSAVLWTKNSQYHRIISRRRMQSYSQSMLANLC